jgi:hypothetical protein
MIKLKSLLLENLNLDDIDKKYPVAGPLVDGREVINKIDNTSSIEASLGNNYKILRGIREVPMADFHVTGQHYSVEGTKRIQQLAMKIKQSNKISVLIVVIDKEGPYILEGSTRIEALFLLGAKSFPALIVVDYYD